MVGYGRLKNYRSYTGGVSSDYVNPSRPAELAGMNLSEIRDKSKVSVFPELIPSGEPVHSPYYTCFRPRSTKTEYIKDVEVFEHPQHFSRFGYARCFNGYCFGHMPGRYIVPDDCSVNDQPYDTAPKRFYTLESIGQCGL